MIGSTIKHYRILSQLGAGGMGVVYKAEDTKLGRVVALKFLPSDLAADADARKRLLNEARAVSQLQHNNICAIHEINETDDGRLFICMDYYEGETLKERLDRGAINVREALLLVAQIADGLDVAHGAGIIHRDIKPANIVITSDGVAKILDFGLARYVGQTKLTREGNTVGTVAYMSPEQIRGEELDARSDQFSLGVTFYEMLTGRHPFHAEFEAAIVHKIQSEPLPTLNAEAPAVARLEPIIQTMCEKGKESRYRTTEDAIEALARVRGGAMVSKYIAHQRRVAIALGAVLVLMAGIMAWFSFRDRPAHGAEPRLAILYFDNMTSPDDPERLGEIATNLLITDLSESKFVKVVSSQRLYDALKNLGKEGAKIIDRETATRVARATGATQMLVGSIIQRGESIALTAQLIDVASGDARASQRIQSSTTDDIFSLVDRLSAEVRNDLDLPGAAAKERSVQVADVTTHSAESYRYYLAGVEAHNKLKVMDAITNFKQAVSIDSTFARGWLALTDLSIGNLGRSRADVEHAQAMAKKHSDKLSNVDRLRLEGRTRLRSGDYRGGVAVLEQLAESAPDEKGAFWDLHWCYQDRSNGESIKWLKRVLALDPRDRMACNELAYAYQSAGNIKMSDWAIGEYARIAPNDANVYDTQGDIYGRRGELNRAKAAYETAVKLDQTFGPSWYKLGYLAVLEGNESRARECWDRVEQLGDPVTREWVQLFNALRPLYYGRSEEAVRVLERAIAEDQASGYHGYYLAAKHFWIGAIHAERSADPAPLDDSFAKIEEPYREEPVLVGLKVVFLCGIDVSVAERELDRAESRNEPIIGMLRVAKGWVDMANHHIDAIDDISAGGSLPVAKQYTAGVAYLTANRIPESIEALENAREMVNSADMLLMPPTWRARVHYYLGQAYESNHEPDKAIMEYSRFVDLWKTADPVFMDEVDDARSRIAKLRT